MLAISLVEVLLCDSAELRRRSLLTVARLGLFMWTFISYSSHPMSGTPVLTKVTYPHVSVRFRTCDNFSIALCLLQIFFVMSEMREESDSVLRWFISFAKCTRSYLNH